MSAKTELHPIAVKLRQEELIKLNRLRAELQEMHPNRVITRTDVIRHCIATATSTAHKGLETQRVGAETKPSE